MTLYDTIINILDSHGKPILITELKDLINKYSDNRYTLVTEFDISIEIEKNKDLISNINGLIFKKNDHLLNDILKTFYNIKEFLDWSINNSNKEIVIIAFFFFELYNGEKLDYFTYSYKYKNDIDLKEIISYSEFEEIYSGLFFHIDNLDNRLDILNKEEYACIFEYLISLYYNDSKNKVYSTPGSIKSLISKLTVSESNSILDPFCGRGNLLSSILRNRFKSEVIGYENDVVNCVISSLTLELYSSNSRIYNLNNKRYSDFYYNEFDLIASDLYFHSKDKLFFNEFTINQIYNDPFGVISNPAKNSFIPYIDYCLGLLSKRGKAILTVSDSFLTKLGNEKYYRLELVKRDYVDTIISLPKGIYKPFSESKFSILILNKNKDISLRNKIKFINVPAIYFNKRNICLNEDLIISQYLNENFDPQYTQIIDEAELDNNYTLSADKFNFDYALYNNLLKDGTAKSLKDLAKIITGKSSKKDQRYSSIGVPIIKIENLSKRILDLKLEFFIEDLDKIDDNDLENYKKSIVSEPSILIAQIGDYLKPTIFYPTEDVPSIILHKNVIALIPKKNIDLDYLYYQLYSSLVENQINNIRKTGLIPYLTIVDFTNVVIPYSDIENQKIYIDTQRNNLIAAELKKLELKKKEIGLKEDSKEAELNIVRTITHQLKHHLSTIHINIKKVSNIIDNKNLGTLKEYDELNCFDDELFEKPENEDLSTVINNVLENSSLLNKILMDVQTALNLELKLELLNIYSVLDDFKNSSPFQNIQIKGEKDIMVLISKHHFQDLFNTLINNAKQHSGLQYDKLKISFNIKYKKDTSTLLIEYRNNGNKMTIPECDYKSIMTKSIRSEGNGIGGFYINKIVEAHSGKLIIDENVEKGILIKIELPITQNEYN